MQLKFLSFFSFPIHLFSQQLNIALSKQNSTLQKTPTKPLNKSFFNKNQCNPKLFLHFPKTQIEKKNNRDSHLNGIPGATKWEQ